MMKEYILTANGKINESWDKIEQAVEMFGGKVRHRLNQNSAVYKAIKSKKGAKQLNGIYVESESGVDVLALKLICENVIGKLDHITTEKILEVGERYSSLLKSAEKDLKRLRNREETYTDSGTNWQNYRETTERLIIERDLEYKEIINNIDI